MEQISPARPRSPFRLQAASAGLHLSPFEFLVLTLVLLATITGAYFVYARTTGLNAAPAPVASSGYIPAFTTNLSSTVSTNGTVQANQQVSLNFGSSGTIAAIDVQAGDSVVTGQELASLDDTQLRTALRSAQSNLSSAQAKLDALVNPTAADVASAQAAITTARTQVTSAEQALTDLRAKPVVADVTAAQQGVLSAQNALQSAKDALRNAQDAVAAAQRDATSASSDVDSAYTNLSLSIRDLASVKGSCSAASPGLPPKGSKADSAPFVPTSDACKDYATAVGKYGSAASAYNSAIANLSTKTTALSSAQAALNGGNLQRSIQNATLGVTSAQQKLTDAQAKATPADLSQAQGAIDSAKAALLTAQSRYDQLVSPPQDSVLPLQTAVDQAQSSLQTAQDNLDKAVIKAPFDGVITAVNGTVGSQASAASGNANTSLLTLLNPKLIRIDANVDQTDVSKLAVGQRARVSFDALSGYTYGGTISNVGLTPTTQSGVVTYVVSFAIDTSNLSPSTPVPSPGMTAQLAVTTSQANDALVVPSRSIKGSGANATVTVKGANGDEQRPVTTGLTNGTLTQITSGLSAGDLVLYSLPAATTTTNSSSNQPNQQFQFGGFQGGAGQGGRNQIVIGGR